MKKAIVTLLVGLVIICSLPASYHTINGNINVTYQPGLSADLQFKSMHGDFFTNFPQAVLLPASV